MWQALALEGALGTAVLRPGGPCALGAVCAEAPSPS